MSGVPNAGFRFPEGARNYWRPAPGPTRDVPDADAAAPARSPPSIQLSAGLVPALSENRPPIALSDDTGRTLAERPAPGGSGPPKPGRLASDVRRLEGRLDAAERLSEARLDARFARLEVSLERILHAQTDALRDLTTKLEFLGARQADGEAAARGLAAQLEATRAERSEDRRAARRRHVQVIAAIVGAALAMTAALIGPGPFGIGAVKIGATSPTPRSEEPAVTPREQAAAQGPV